MIKRIKVCMFSLVCMMALIIPSVSVFAEDVEPCASYTICSRCNGLGATISVTKELIDTVPWICDAGYEHVIYVYQDFIVTTCPSCGRFTEEGYPYTVEDECTHVR